MAVIDVLVLKDVFIMDNGFHFVLMRFYGDNPNGVMLLNSDVMWH